MESARQLGSWWQEPFRQRAHSLPWIHETFLFIFKFPFFCSFSFWAVECFCIFLFFCSICISCSIEETPSLSLSFSLSFLNILPFLASSSLLLSYPFSLRSQVYTIRWHDLLLPHFGMMGKLGRTWLRLASSYTPTFIQFLLKIGP